LAQKRFGTGCSLEGAFRAPQLKLMETFIVMPAKAGIQVVYACSLGFPLAPE
jgi:hypothetical protein